MGIKQHREERKAYFKYWIMKEGVAPAVKEFMVAINDPHAEYFKAAYYSYNKGCEVKDKLAAEIAQKYGIDPKVLYDAHLDQTSKIMLGGAKRYLES